MVYTRFSYGLLALVLAFSACTWDGQNASRDREARDLTLPPAESFSQLNDRPIAEPLPERQPEGLAPLPSQPEVPPESEAPEPDLEEPTPEPEPEPEPVVAGPEPLSEPTAAPSLPEGTVLTIYPIETVTTRANRIGEPVSATIGSPVLNGDGEVVIPAGAVFRGTISDLAAPQGDEGRMELTFTNVEFNGASYPVQAVAANLPTERKRRGNTVGDIAKVGAGALVGGILGGIFGGNKKGAGVGALGGAAVGVAAVGAGRGWDLSLAAGTPVQCVTSDPFVPTFVYQP